MEYRKKKKIIRTGIIILFTLYLILLAYFLFFADSWGRTHLTEDYHYNFIPFKEILRFWTYRDILSMRVVCLNLIGNVIVLIPFGMFLPMLLKKCRKWICVILLSFVLSLSIELVQLVARVGSFDVDDMILNTIGGAIGFLLYLLLRRVWNKYHEEKKQL
ncbi:MAG: VanZ family protein [Lachnospiraceae bacterium]